MLYKGWLLQYKSISFTFHLWWHLQQLNKSSPTSHTNSYPDIFHTAGFLPALLLGSYKCKGWPCRINSLHYCLEEPSLSLILADAPSTPDILHPSTNEKEACLTASTPQSQTEYSLCTDHLQRLSPTSLWRTQVFCFQSQRKHQFIPTPLTKTSKSLQISKPHKCSSVYQPFHEHEIHSSSGSGQANFPVSANPMDNWKV
jgi:hypothetical protein